MNYKIKKAFEGYEVGEEKKMPYSDAVRALLEHCGFIEPITEWSADKLKDGDVYWYLDSVGNHEENVWLNISTDRFRLKSKNIYRTKEEKEKHEFVHASKMGMSGGEYLIIYCKKCGQVSFDQSIKSEQIEIKPCS